ncbi:TKL/IRAK protein kinase [Capsaspora owczarzaki ATCC 30864]|uniref:non-specific serine/threonine protein kinase n=1 Tax=Capsaspora owczarzaki (strain ATCC 30864) TaxID=595528 RepID=A0A0D2UFH2_CAPO3|nr:TKL/IRAK protein kinase [Capsaspora owczarzaki ATCC 30864]
MCRVSGSALDATRLAKWFYYPNVSFLKGKQIGDAKALAIAEGLKVNKTLTTLNLSVNQIGDAGTIAIADALKVNTTLTTVYLGENQIGDAGAQAIAEALKMNTTLTELGLHQNQIGDAGAQAIADALKVNKTVTTIYLYTNQIGDDGALAIAEAFKVNTTLTTLSLQQNQIGDVGAQAIAEALKVTKTLTTLFLWQNQIGDAGAQALAEALKVNKTLTMLYLNENFLTNTGINALRQTGNITCNLDGLDQQRVPSSAELAQIAARAAANVAEIQQLRSDLTAKDKTLQQLRSDLAAKDQQLTAKAQALVAKDQELAAKNRELKSALDQIDVLERNQAACGSFSNFDGPVPQVPLATLVSATNNFATDSLLGEGAFGRVYSASLPGPRVAIKKLSAESKQGTVEFKSELDSLSKFRHANIIAILSYAEEGDERCLVYEFMPNGSVRDRLNRKNNTPPLTWSQRHRIAADVARGMHYVQTAFPDHALFHLDLKTDNVLLDAYFNAKVADFGLVRAAQLDDQSYLRTSNVQGTKAYMCPEFLIEGRMTIKTDVYAFGMILLELATAAKPGPRLKTDMRKAVKTQKFVEMLDSALKPSEAELQSISELVTLAMECLDEAADDRPSFGSILVSLDP